MKIRHRKRTVGQHEDVATMRAMAAFIAFRGLDNALARATAIGRLPAKEWRGRRLYEIRCDGPYGKGPHVQYVPASLLWALTSLHHYLCPYHR